MWWWSVIWCLICSSGEICISSCQLPWRHHLQWQIVNRIIRSIIIIIIILLWYYWNIHFMVCLCQMIAAITFIKNLPNVLGRGGRQPMHYIGWLVVSTRRWCGPYYHITLWILWLGYSQRYAVARNRGTVSIWISHSEIVIVGYRVLTLLQYSLLWKEADRSGRWINRVKIELYLAIKQGL